MVTELTGKSSRNSVHNSPLFALVLSRMYELCNLGLMGLCHFVRENAFAMSICLRNDIPQKSVQVKREAFCSIMLLTKQQVKSIRNKRG